MNRTLSKFGAASGACFVIAVVVGSVLNAVGPTADGNATVSVATYQRELYDHEQDRLEPGRSRIPIPGGLPWLPPHVAASLRGTRRSVFVLGAGLLYLALQLGELVTVMAGRNPDDPLTTEIANTLLDLDEAAFAVSGLMFGVLVLLVGVACTVYRTLPRWLTLAGVCLGVPTVAAGGIGVISMGTYLPAP